VEGPRRKWPGSTNSMPNRRDFQPLSSFRTPIFGRSYWTHNGPNYQTMRIPEFADSRLHEPGNLLGQEFCSSKRLNLRLLLSTGLPQIMLYLHP
jgi:hypothetical protein